MSITAAQCTARGACRHPGGPGARRDPVERVVPEEKSARGGPSVASDLAFGSTPGALSHVGSRPKCRSDQRHQRQSDERREVERLRRHQEILAKSLNEVPNTKSRIAQPNEAAVQAKVRSSCFTI